MTTIQKKLAIAMLATGMTGAGITMTEMNAHAAPAPVVQVQKDTSARTTPSATSNSDVQRYAARESSAKKQLDYKGGDILVIGMTTTGLVLLLVLALLLV